MTKLAMRFLILTACRSVEIRKFRLEEIDVENSVWTVPAGTRKGGKEHRVPLSGEALSVIVLATPLNREPYKWVSQLSTELGRNREAIRFFEEVQGRHPDLALPWFFRGSFGVQIRRSFRPFASSSCQLV